jgi:hypothetical protein
MRRLVTVAENIPCARRAPPTTPRAGVPSARGRRLLTAPQGGVGLTVLLCRAVVRAPRRDVPRAGLLLRGGTTPSLGSPSSRKSHGP